MRRILITAVVCLVTALGLSAQSARVSGQVVDSRHGVIQVCEVTIRNTGTEARFRTVTTDSGSFLLPPVPPGTYEITASAAGFAIERLTGLTLDVGESKVIELVLQPASLHEVVEVVDTPPEVTTDRPDRSVVIDRTFVASIPLNVRNPLQLINFSPGVTKGDDGLSGQNVTSESRTNTWRINGAKGATTDIAIDGGTDTTAYYNQSAGIPGVDAVQEYRVYTSAFAPEFGRTSGGTVAYALRSGSNAVHGSLFEYLRNSDLDARWIQCRQGGPAHRAVPAQPIRRNIRRTCGTPQAVSRPRQDLLFRFVRGTARRHRRIVHGHDAYGARAHRQFLANQGRQRQPDRDLRSQHHAARHQRAGGNDALHPHGIPGKHRPNGLDQSHRDQAAVLLPGAQRARRGPERYQQLFLECSRHEQQRPYRCAARSANQRPSACVCAPGLVFESHHSEQLLR
ncbi:exported hypothetical protein [Candidatus Sulfopaludibacter sp. SbA3]|nr:exported hypothetical protein [Candidatus Sulfopaludibacter sp. SbA3]